MSKASILFSIITPVYNAEAYIFDTLTKTLNQNIDSAEFEVIVVDDCSTDNTLSELKKLTKQYPYLKVISSDQNQGPGSARNTAMQAANGEWLLFVDADDHLTPNALMKLKNFMATLNESSDLIGFNWGFVNDEKNIKRRKDKAILGFDKKTLINEYLALHMDGSVIFTAVKRSFVNIHQLQFASGYHEDVDFMFLLYWHAQHIHYLDEVIYQKCNREHSIVNSITNKHIDGFIRAWRFIGDFIHTKENAIALSKQYQLGCVGVLATRLRAIYQNSQLNESQDLYAYLYREATKFNLIPKTLDGHTKYKLILQQFIKVMQSEALSVAQKANNINQYLGEVMDKSWSCIDLHHSVFLGPDEIRTCCKRFFVDGEMRGDVALIKIPENQILPITPKKILKEKQKLYQKINAGEDNDCDGCPFLEFKEWEPLDNLDIKYLSFEYHSVCNLKCSYCSDTYYGGKQSNYDVKGLVDKLLDGHMLDNCSTVVWGGGEPVVGKDFDEILEKIVRNIPNANQRVLTNSVKHSALVESLLVEEKISVTTSIDAGNEKTFKKVRGMDSLKKTIKNLQRYAQANSNQVTIKYIFTEGNYALDEVQGFIDLMKFNHLMDCNFQISCDFKHESISLDAVISMIAMYGLLTDANCRLVFFDDLLRQRLGEAHAKSEQTIRGVLSNLGLGHILADRNAFNSVAIWGAGWQSKYLIENSAFFKNVKVEYFIDSRESRKGEKFMNHEIVGPEALLDSDIPVVIAAVQNLPLIYRSFLDLGIDQSRLIKQLII